MPFDQEQTKALSAKLNSKYVKSRTKNGFELSYIEGWHAISEANRVFGYDAWDRQTVMTKCVWEGIESGKKVCSYISRVRIRVRAGDTIVCREGSGAGNGSGNTPGEAHENALKESETDAMKRALMTFGNPFGLALYDKDQIGVRQKRSPIRKVIWPLLDEKGSCLSKHDDPIEYCSAVRALLEGIENHERLISVWRRNQDTVVKLRQDLPDLKTERGQHYGEILSNLYTSRLQEFAKQKVASSSDVDDTQNPEIADKVQLNENSEHVDPKFKNTNGSTICQQTVHRIRDKDHLRFVAEHNCLVCDRFPTQAHHVKFAQPRAMSRKVSDEWTVPLCAFHHRELHDRGNEEIWWEGVKIDPLSEAQKLWQQSHYTQKTG